MLHADVDVAACLVHRREVTPVEKLECDRAGSLELASSASQPPVCLKPGSHVLESHNGRPFRKSRSCTPKETFLVGGTDVPSRYVLTVFLKLVLFFLISRSRRLEISEMSVERVYSAWKYSEDFFNAFTAPGNISKICLTRPEKLEIFLRFLLTRLEKLGMLNNFLAHLGLLEIFQRLVQRV